MARRQVSIFINGREVANQIKSITAEKRKIVRELNNMTIGTDAYKKKTKELDQVNGIINKHKKEINGVQGSWDKIAGGATKFLGIAGIAFTADAVVSYGKELFKAGVEMDTLERKARTVLGEALGFVQQKAMENATAMGLTTQQYVAQTTAIADILIPMGFQRDRAAEISTNLVDLSGALSEWTGGQKSAEEVSKILGKALTGERESLKELGIVIQEADVKARLAEKGLDKLTGTMLQQAKAAATLELITEKSVDAQTSFATNSDSLIRKQAELSAKFKDISERIAVSLIPVFDKLIDIASGAADVIGTIAGAITNLSNPVKAAAEAFDNQSNKVATLEKELTPLLKRYEELTSKSELTEEEQAELAKTIQRIGEVTPTAITEIDEYGRVLSVNTEESKRFLEQEQKRLKFVNQESIAAIEKQITGFESLRNIAKKAAEEGESWAGIDYSPERITGFRKEVESLTAKIEGARAELERLNGTSLQKAAPSEGGGSGGGGGASSPDDPDAAAKAEAAAQEAADKAKKAAEDRAKEAKKAAEAEAREIEQIQINLNEALAKIKEEARIAELSEDEQKIERVKQKYADEIALAKELQAKGHQEGTAQLLELERIRDQEVNALKEQLAQAAIDADLEKEAIKDEEQIQKDLDYINKRREVEESVQEELRTVQEQALLETELYYFDLIGLAEQYSVDTAAIEAKRLKAIEGINKKFREDQAKDETAAIKAKAEAHAAAFQALASATEGALGLISDESKEFIILSKGLALAQVGFSTAAAIASATAGGAAAGPFPYNVIAIGLSIAAVLNAIGQAKKILSSTPVPQKKEGGYLNVTGADDGKSYRAKYIGSPQSGMLPSHPVVLASEAGQEYFVSNHDLQNPVVANYVRMIDNISRNRVAQFAEGGAAESGEPAELPSVPAPVSLENTALAGELRRLNDILESGIFAVIDDDEVIRVFNKYDSLNEASGGTLGS